MCNLLLARSGQLLLQSLDHPHEAFGIPGRDGVDPQEPPDPPLELDELGSAEPKRLAVEGDANPFRYGATLW